MCEGHTSVFSVLLAIVQILVGADKASKLTRASKLIREAAANGAQIVVPLEYYRNIFAIQDHLSISGVAS